MSAIMSNEAMKAASKIPFEIRVFQDPTKLSGKRDFQQVFKDLAKIVGDDGTIDEKSSRKCAVFYTDYETFKERLNYVVELRAVQMLEEEQSK